MAAPIPVGFVGGSIGAWRILKIEAVVGDSLAQVERLGVYEEMMASPAGGAVWVLRGVTGHLRYVTRAEKDTLDAVSPPLGREAATRAALIPIRKSAAWWELSQDERRAIFEERSHHISDSLKYLPAVARRLYHSRELGEPFDFLTWFEYAPEHAGLFEELVRMLRSREEWRFVEREVDIRLARVV